MQTQTVFFSVVMSTLNAEETLRECLGSLQSQTFRDFELIVQDGCSKDDTLNIFREFSEMMPNIESVRDLGVYDAWNKALQRCSGKWVYFLGADNLLHDSNVLADVADRLRQVPESVSLAYGRIVRVDEQLNRIDERGLPWLKTRRSFCRYLVSLPHAAAFQRLSELRSLGGFPACYRIKADSSVMLASALESAPLYLDRAIVLHRMGGVSTKPQHQVSAIKEARKVLKENGMPTIWVNLKLAAGLLVGGVAKLAGWKSLNYLLEKLRSYSGGYYSK